MFDCVQLNVCLCPAKCLEQVKYLFMFVLYNCETIQVFKLKIKIEKHLFRSKAYFWQHTYFSLQTLYMHSSTFIHLQGWQPNVGCIQGAVNRDKVYSSESQKTLDLEDDLGTFNIQFRSNKRSVN